MNILDLMSDWRAIVLFMATVGTAAIKLFRSGPDAKRRSGRMRTVLAHLDRERQHAETILKLYRAEDENESLSRQIDLMNQRIDDLQDRFTDGLSPGSRAELLRRTQRRKKAESDSRTLDAKSIGLNPP